MGGEPKKLIGREGDTKAEKKERMQGSFMNRGLPPATGALSPHWGCLGD